MIFLCAGTQAISQFVWLEFGTPITFKSMTNDCEDGVYPNDYTVRPVFFFSAEVRDKKVTRARVSKSTMDVRCSGPAPLFMGYSPSISFSESEIKEVELYFDKQNRPWVKTLPWNSRFLAWLVANKTGCKPYEEPQKIEPAHALFQFKIDGLGDTVFETQTDIAVFKGFEKGGNAYRATLVLKQKRLGK